MAKGELTGRTLGNYEIGERLGSGGMATVYVAEQTTIGRQVAIKVMPGHLTHDPTFIQRFEQEVQVIADLQHPRVLTVHDYGEIEGRPYIVMALATGGTLTDLIEQEGPLPLAETTKLVEQVAEGLDHAHRQGVIHRDFKPSNVLLDQFGNAYLADFGIAKLSESQKNLTGSGIIGTPAYMAPEMIERGDVAPSVDIYALGVTLYILLTGEEPFKGETPMQVMMAHARQDIPQLKEKRPDLPREVQHILNKAMAKKPANRYQSAGDMAKDLRRVVRQSDVPTVERLKEDLRPPAPPSGPTSAPSQTPSVPQPNQQQAATAEEEGGGPPTWLIVAGLLLTAVCIGGAGIALFAAAGSPTAEATPTEPLFVTTEAPPTATEVPAAGGSEDEATETPAPAACEPTGRIAFTQTYGEGAELVAMRADGTDLRILTNNDTPDSEPDWSPNGRFLAYGAQAADSTTQLFLIDTETLETRQLTSEGISIDHPAFSPEGNAIAFEIGGTGSKEIAYYDREAETVTRLTNDTSSSRAPQFSPDGSQIAYMNNGSGQWRIQIMTFPGGDLVNTFDCPEADCRFPAWSADGSQIAYNTFTDDDIIGDIYIMDVATGQSTSLISGPRVGRPTFTSDGCYLYFNRDISGIDYIYRFDLEIRQETRITNRGEQEYGPDWTSGE